VEEPKLTLRIAVAEGILSDSEARALSEAVAGGGPGVLERLRSDGRVSDAMFASLCARLEDPAEQPAGLASGLGNGLGNGLGEVSGEVSAEASGNASGDPLDQSVSRALNKALSEDSDVATRSLGVAHDDTWAYTPAHQPASDERADPAAFPLPGWDRYEPICLLGQGGMGRVFLARDLRLGRKVAIKFVRGDDPDLTRRIVAEARAQARVNDERVCKVYEVGEVRGRVYIAMQHIDGKPLSELYAELTAEQKAIVVRGAALGIAEAHRVGLIHRDIKPSNIMVERGTDGELRPYVMDFGLARDWADGTTMTGTVLGTPQYMAPEQARGEVERLDRRADVYSLGATLYAMLTNQPPFVGTNPLMVLARISVDEPARPRVVDPNVPADLEAIVLKCLEKDRTARYDSARALADDLGRFLAGEPVAARASAGLGYRLRKQLRRHARLVAGVAVALTLVAVALGFALHERRQASQREALARQFTERVERIESIARYAAMAPMHDLRPDRERLRAAMDALAEEVRAGGALAEGPGHYALGRGYLALGDDERAAEELATAWARGFQEPRAAYALALAEGHLYQRALHEVERLPADLRAARRREVEARHREPALRYLRASGGPEVPSPAYVAALLAFYEGRYDDALAQLDGIARDGGAQPWFYEAPLLRGEVLWARARAGSSAGGAPARVVDDLAAARRTLDAAAAIGESEPAVHAARAELELLALGIELYGGGAVDAPYARGIEAVGKVLTLLPGDPEALAQRARLLRSLADHKSRRGEDPTELLTRAIADAQWAMTVAPESREARLALSSIYRQWGEARQARSEDPSEQLRRAAEIAEAMPAADRDAELLLDLGLIHTVWADYQDGVGQDSAEHRGRAIEAYTQAVQLAGNFVDAWLNLGNNYVRRASQPRSADADRDLKSALEALARGRGLEPTNSAAYLYEGDAHALAAQRKLARGLDPGADHAQAIELYRKGAAAGPGEPAFHNAISAELLQQAKEAQDGGRVPLAFLEQAEAAARQAIALAPDQGFAYSNAGEALTRRAAYQRAHGIDPLPAARAAEADFAQALERLPEHPAIWMNAATLYALLAEIEQDGSGDPGARAGRALVAIERALALNASDPQAQQLRDEIRALVARAAAARAAAGPRGAAPRNGAPHAPGP
jgi:serine/threonine-protein kinase